MNCYQYKIVCQVKYEVLAIVNTFQLLKIQSVHSGLPIPVVSDDQLKKLQQLQDLLIFNNIHAENFDLGDFTTECLINAEIQLELYLNSCIAVGYFYQCQ
ncbi:RAP domain-containing protein [Caenorhabditis elegans]|uniref:RAP domain-containing protein n=1 Tax=Caenorhabditis elegans TaxID=6239 RepID=H2L270_CAEEL|nr:RAP domain-containing protein [Caenorhabditis elegans]CCE71438.1 RAP domain-containing protein [Caenorhabditis elegans]|eukprot:NP_001254888.1 Uncharacterized protein CELE_C01G12.16 [Caenorhabditis elegans]